MEKFKAMGQKALFALNIGYYDGHLYKLVSEGGTPKWRSVSDKQFKPWILIVGRAYYEEQAKIYPIDNRREVSKLVSLELEQRSGDCTFMTFPVRDGKISANSWHFGSQSLTQEQLSLIRSAKIRIPESAILAWNAPLLSPVVYQCPNHRLFTVNTQKGVVSSLQGGLIQGLDSFAIASGIALTTSSERSSVDHVEAIVRGLPALLLNHPSAFIQTAQTQGDWQTNLNRLVIGAMLGTACYLGLSSGYLMWREHQIDSQMAQQQAKVSQSLSIQSEYQQLVAQLEGQHSFIDSQQATTGFWQVLEPVLQKSRLRTIRYRNGRYQLNGEADKATEIIELLNLNPEVKDAKFDTQTRKSRKKEVFLISFLIEPDLQEKK